MAAAAAALAIIARTQASGAIAKTTANRWKAPNVLDGTCLFITEFMA
jgi:hypothetical protein